MVRTRRVPLSARNRECREWEKKKKKKDGSIAVIAGFEIEIFVLCKRKRNPSTCSRRFSQDHQRVPRARVAPPAYHAQVDRCRWITKLRKARVLLPEYRSRFRFRRWLSVLISRDFISVSSTKISIHYKYAD